MCVVLYCCTSRHRVEREEKAKLRSAGQSWKDKSFQPHELAEQLEDDRRRFQLRVVDVSEVVICNISISRDFTLTLPYQNQYCIYYVK